MAQFGSNAQRLDPYKNFIFRVKWEGRYVAGISEVSALGHSTQAVDNRKGGVPRRSYKFPSRTKYPAITLAMGVTQDSEFRMWLDWVWIFGSNQGGEVPIKDIRKDIIIEVYNEDGQLAGAYKINHCWVSEYQVGPDLDANANPVAIEIIRLENEGMELDYDVAMPSEPA